MRYGNSWGLTVQRGPWKETAKDLNYGSVNQKHAGHGDWYQVERPSMNPAGSYSIPTLKRKRLLYSSTNEYTPKSRPGRLQKSVYTEGMRKELASRPTTGLGQSTVAAQPPSGFRLGGGNFDSPEVKSEESIKDENLSNFFTMGAVADFDVGSNIFYTPVSSFNPSTPTNIKEEPMGSSVYGTPQTGRPPPIDTSMGGGYDSMSPVAPTISPLSSVVQKSPDSLGLNQPTISPISSIGYSSQEYLDPVGHIQAESSPAVGIVGSELPVTPLVPEFQPPAVDPVVEDDINDYHNGRWGSLIGNLVIGYPNSTHPDAIVNSQPHRLDDGTPVDVQTVLRLAALTQYFIQLNGGGPDAAMETLNFLVEKMEAPDGERWLRRVYRGMQMEQQDRAGPATTRSASNVPGPVMEPVQSVTNVINEQQPVTEEAEDEVDEDAEDAQLLALLDPLSDIKEDEKTVNGMEKWIIWERVSKGWEMSDDILKWLQYKHPDKYQEWYVNNLRWKDTEAAELEEDIALGLAKRPEGTTTPANAKKPERAPPTRRGR